MGDKRQEFEAVFDRVSYELSSARAAGLDRPEEARAALKRARELVTDAEMLAASMFAEQVEPGEV